MYRMRLFARRRSLAAAESLRGGGSCAGGGCCAAAIIARRRTLRAAVMLAAIVALRRIMRCGDVARLRSVANSWFYRGDDSVSALECRPFSHLHAAGGSLCEALWAHVPLFTPYARDLSGRPLRPYRRPGFWNSPRIQLVPVVIAARI